MGMGLRFPHFDEILETKPKVPWFEVITDDFLSDSPAHEKLLKLRKDYPITFFSVAMNLGGVDRLDKSLINKLQELYSRYQPEWISDHLCWSAHGGLYHHDLMPIPKTKEALKNIIGRIQYLQDRFKRPLVLENITQYIQFKNEDYSEAEFIINILNSCGSYLLLDISNILINIQNNIVSESWIHLIPPDRIMQIHLSGTDTSSDVIIDSHSQKVTSGDISLTKKMLNNNPTIPILLERDVNLPNFITLEKERASIEHQIYGNFFEL